jgi:hypothetical protein
MSVNRGTSADDEPCPDCGRDVFGCECPPPAAEVYTADDVAAAIAAERAKVQRSRQLNEGFRGAVADLKARLAESESRCADLEARAAAHPGERNDLRAQVARGRVAGDRAALARAEAAEGEGGYPPRPGNLGVYLARLEDPPRITYAHALAAHLLDGADAPAPVDAAWFAKVDAKVRRLSAPHVGR